MHTGQLLFRLWRASHLRAADALEPVGLTTALYALLEAVEARDGAIQQELGEAVGIDRTTMVALVDGLEAAGLARRRPSPADRRARVVSITPKGRRTLARARKLLAEAEDEVLAGLTSAERRKLATLLRRALDAAPPQPLWSAQEGPRRNQASASRHSSSVTASRPSPSVRRPA